MSQSHPSLVAKSVQKKTQTHFKSKDDYEKCLRDLQTELLSLQQKIRRKNRKLIVVLEGPDAAGKGGIIQRLTQYLDPRDFLVHPTRAPSADELGQHYLQRFFARLPEPGQIAIFDRSWYGRVLVERVEGFAEKSAWKRAYDEINAFEKILQNDGIQIRKYLIDVTYKEQQRRFEERAKDPLKSWKLTPEDFRNRKRWDDYHAAFQDMLRKTSPKHCPWKLVPGDSKWYARVKVLEDLVARG